jgi:putative ABC transport system permease protein
MNRSGMLLRVVAKSFWFHPARISASLAALTVGATLCSAFLSLYFVLPSKMSGEFRTLGPNLVIAPREGEQTFSADSVQRLESSQPQVQAVPWLYAIGTAADGSVVMAGTDLARAASLNPGWRVVAAQAGNGSGETLQDFLKGSGEAFLNQPWLLAGERAASHFGWKAGQSVELAYGEKKISLPLRAVISSGQSEDSQVLLPLASLQDLTSQPGRLSLIQARVPGPAGEVESRRQEIAALLPELEARPLRQVVEAETGVVMKVQALMYGLTAVVLGIVILSVMTTFSGLVLDRQRDIGIMKTLGGSDGVISILFIAEAAAAALIAAAFGHSIGFGLAAWAARGIFHSPLPWRWDVLASVTGVTLAVALIATTIPIRLVRKLEPVEILKGS